MKTEVYNNCNFLLPQHNICETVSPNKLKLDRLELIFIEQ